MLELFSGTTKMYGPPGGPLKVGASKNEITLNIGFPTLSCFCFCLYAWQKKGYRWYRWSSLASQASLLGLQVGIIENKSANK
jgi:hypothetical protein